MKIFLLLFLVIQSSFAIPKRVILIRHAEKPSGEEGVNLSPKGILRAKALPQFFKKFHENNPIVKVFAQGLKHSDSSRRPIQTVVPTAKALGLTINKSFVKGDAEDLVEWIEETAAYNGKTVIVSWGHDELAEIAEEFGYYDLYSKELHWDKNVYDRAWVLDFDVENEELKSFKSIPQRLLKGDSLK